MTDRELHISVTNGDDVVYDGPISHVRTTTVYNPDKQLELWLFGSDLETSSFNDGNNFSDDLPGGFFERTDTFDEGVNFGVFPVIDSEDFTDFTVEVVGNE